MPPGNRPLRQGPVLAASALGIAILLAGCSIDRLYHLPPNPPNPFPDAEKIVVMPLIGRIPPDLDAERGAQLLALEAMDFPGFRVMGMPAEAEALIQNTHLSPRKATDLLGIGRALQADAILVLEIHEWDYYQPRVAMTLALLRTNPRGQERPIWDMIESGRSWIPEGRGTEGLLGVVQKTYDGRNRTLVRQLKAWANRHDQQADPNWEQYLVTQERYIRFCANQVLRALCDAGKEANRSESRSNLTTAPTPKP